MAQIKVLLVDDSEHLGAQMKQVFDADNRFKIIGQLTSAIEIIPCINELSPDLILMDINMPEVSGLEAVKIVRGASIQTPILMQTVYETDEYLFESILAGANGYVLKNTPAHRLLEYAFEATHSGTPFSPGMAQKVLEFIRSQKSPQANEAHSSGLSNRSIDVLNLLANGYSYKEIATQLNIGLDGVSYHVKKLYSTLHIHSREEIKNPEKWWYKLLKK